MPLNADNFIKNSLRIGWGEYLTAKERQKKIEEVEKWLLYRSNDDGWVDIALKVLLQEVYVLREKARKD